LRKFFVDIEDLYEKVNEKLPTFTDNPCGECRACCTVEGVHRMKVTELEFLYLEHKTDTDRATRFRRYVAREIDKSGRYIFPQCPYLAEEGCSVHPHRPLACRLFGHFRGEDEPVLAGYCVFRGTETVVPTAEKRNRLPGNLRLNNLNAEFRSYQPAPSGPQEIPTSPPPVEARPLDLAFRAAAEDRFEEALQQFQRVKPERLTPLILRTIASCYQGLGDFGSAEQWYRKALTEAPDNPQFHYECGCNYLLMGRNEEARQALHRALELAPDRANALAMLGFSYQVDAHSEEARPYLLKAVEKDPESGFARLQLGLAEASLGLNCEARENLKLALRDKQTRGQARLALKSLES